MSRRNFSLYLRDVPMGGTDWLVDAVIALGAFGFGLLQMSASVNLMIPDDFVRRLLGVRTITLSVWGIAMVALTCVPLVVRRRLPWPVFVLSTVLWAFFEMQMGAATLSLIGPLIALFTVTYECSKGEAVGAGGILLIVVAVCAFSASTSSLAMLMLVQNVAVVVAVALAGFALHAGKDSMKVMEARAAEAELTREIHAEKRVEEERLRIAREVHDITAHSLSAVSIQSAAAVALIDSDPEAAKSALENIRKTSKDALSEMRGIIAVLRDGSSDADTQPMMGIEDLPGLKDYLEDAGVATALHVDKREEPLPAYISMALYGISREAATNIVRHSHASTASINLTVGSDEAALEIEDDGCGIKDASMGHGIEGMRERVKVLGGTFDISAGELAGTKISVHIPIAHMDVH